MDFATSASEKEGHISTLSNIDVNSGAAQLNLHILSSCMYVTCHHTYHEHLFEQLQIWMFAATLLRNCFPEEAPTPHALFELQDPTVHQSEPLHSSRVSSHCWTTGKHHVWGKLSPRWAGWPDSPTPHCHQNQREGSSKPVWQGTEERSQDTHTAQVHSYTRLVKAWQVPYEQSPGEPGERTIGNGLKEESQQCRGATLQREDKEKEQQRNPTAKRGWEDFSLQKALGSKRKICIWS